MNFSKYTNKNAKEVFEVLKTSQSGLSENEARQRLRVYGLNEIKIKGTTLFDVLLRQFKSPFFYLLVIAALVAFLIGEKIDSFVILAFIFINVTLGFSQEARAVKAASILKKYIAPTARVLRDGQEKTIEQKFLVPGDIVLLEAGNIIPADLRILKTENFIVDEAVLSGESAPLGKTSQPLIKEAKEIFEAQNIVFAATTVVSGEAQGIVISTGKNTVFGEIAKLTGETKKESAYEKDLFSFSRLILKIVVISIVTVFLAKLLISQTRNFLDFLIFCIALVVSIIPEALPVVVTFAFSHGALRLAKNKVVVKRLSSVEDLGDIEILCSDKTGTLTENKLRLDNIFSSDKEKCLLYALLSSAFIKEEIESIQNPFDAAIIEKAPPPLREKVLEFNQLAEIPFDNDRMRYSALFKTKSEKSVLIIKGAPETILDICSIFEGGLDPEQITKNMEADGKQGKRILAIAYKQFSSSNYGVADEKDLIFLGYLSYLDPIKETARATVELAKKLGVQIKILTGDTPQVAGYVAKQIGLIDNIDKVISGKDLESLSQEKFEEACLKYFVFARVSPQTKFQIIQTLEKKSEVGFLGEGINDAPALKIANVAIAVREGADISREVSDIILLERDLRVIVEGIKEGRNIFSNVNKYIKCTLASNFGNFYSIAAIALFIPFLPMLPIQILLVNLLSDFPLIAVATDKIDTEELRKPKLYQLRQVIKLIILLALVSTIFDFTFFAIFRKVEPAYLQTLWFIESILTEIALIFSIRTRLFFLKAKKASLPLIAFSLFSAAVTISLPFTNFGHQFFHFASPPFFSLMIVFSLLIGYFIVSEIVKLVYFRHWKIQNRKKEINLN